MYRIMVYAQIGTDIFEEGYFSGCYRANTPDGTGTFISYDTGNGINKNNIKTFKTMSQAKAKLKFLEEKIEQNGYMWHWKLEIEEVN